MNWMLTSCRACSRSTKRAGSLCACSIAAFAAILICGASVFTSCSSNDTNDNPSPEQPKKNRAEFIAHTRQNLKEVAENLNFTSWNVAHSINSNFNQSVLNNPAFEKTISKLFSQTIQQTIKPVEEGSELAQMGFKMYATVDLTAFNYRFKLNRENNNFDVEPAEDFEMIVPAKDPDTQQVIDDKMKLTLKAGGSSYLQILQLISTQDLAVVVKVPVDFAFSISANTEEGWTDMFTGIFKNEVQERNGSGHFSLVDDAFNISGTITSFLPSVAEKGLTGDATTIHFAIGQDPAIHQAGMNLTFIHNGRTMLRLRGVMENLNGVTQYSQFTSGTSIVELFAAIMAGNSLKEGTITLIDDLTTTLTISDCGKLLELQRAMASARRNYADQMTIDGYTQHLNELISGTMTCKGLNQTIPMKLQTIKFGVDYWAMPALNFADENGYVAITDMLDKESIEYMINIVDHAAEPMQQSIITVRQLMQFIQTLTSTIKEKQQKNPLR